MSIRVGKAAQAPDFPDAARTLVKDAQLRHNVRRATDTIRGKRGRVVAEMPDWEQLRDAAHAIKDHTLRHLDTYLLQFEENCRRAGGQVHWARDADEANRIVIDLMRARGRTEVIKVKTMTSDEIQLNPALEAAGITPYETDLADMIVQLGEDEPSHIVVPALHRNRSEIRELFLREDAPRRTGRAAPRPRRRRPHLPPRKISPRRHRHQRRQLRYRRYRLGLRGGVRRQRPHVRHAAAPAHHPRRASKRSFRSFDDLEVFLQLLPRSATGERMNPYNSIWTGVTPGDGPQEFHVILLDNGRTHILAQERSRETLDCIRCGACLNACPVYRETGGHAYGSIYCRSHRRDPFAAIAIHAALAIAALRVLAVRCLL